LQRLFKNISPPLMANLLIIFTMIAWGTSFISTKIAIAEIPPFTLALLRLSLTSAILWPVFRHLEPTTRLDSTGKRRFAITGFLGITLYFCLENMGLRFTTASNASLITSFAPLLSIALSVMFFRARLSLVEILGVLLGITGSYLTITANGNLDFSSENFVGNLFVIGAMFSWTLYTIFSQKQQARNSDLAIVTYQTIFGTLLLIPFALTEFREWQLFSLQAFGQILYLAAICSAACYFFYIYALKILDIALTTLYLNLVPVTGVITGFLVLGETIYPSQIVGGLLIISAILTANSSKLIDYFSQKRHKKTV